MTGFVIVVDMQWDFVMASGALPVPDAEALIQPMQDWLARLDPAEVAGVLLTYDTHVPAVYARSPEAAEFPIHCVYETKGWGSVLETDLVNPAIPLYRLEKGVFDMWAESNIAIAPHTGSGGSAIDRDTFFRTLAATGIDTVTVVGVATDYCVRWAVNGLVERGFAVTLPASLTRGIALAPDAVFGDFQASGHVTLSA